MTNSEIIKEMQENFKEIELIIQNQEFKTKDAYRIMKRYGNLIRCAEDLEKSRDNWREKYKKLKEGEKNGRKKTKL